MSEMRSTIRVTNSRLVLLFSMASWILSVGFFSPCHADDHSSEIASLIEALGDVSFSTRQEAEAEIRKHGAKALPLLKKASETSDLEIQTRSKQLIQEIEIAIYQKELKDFEDGKSSSIAHWDRYQKLVGSTEADRKFFVSLHKAEPDLMRISPENTKRLSNAYRARVDQIYFEYRTPSKSAFGLQRRNLKELSFENCALLYLSTYKENQFHGYSQRTFTYICGALNSKTNLANLLADSAKLKMYNYWLQNGEMTSVRERLYSAKKLDDENSILILSRKAIEAKNPKSLVTEAITLIVKIKEWKAIPELMQYLEDTSDVSYYPKNRNRGITLQLRDAALIGLLLATAQDPKNDYKFLSPSSSRYTGKYVGFVEEKNRVAAHEKWKSWWEENQSNYQFEESKP